MNYIQLQPNTSFWIEAHATSHGTVTQSKEITGYPQLNTLAHRHPWLPCVVVIYKRKRACQPSHPANMAKFVHFNSSHRWRWHCWNSRTRQICKKIPQEFRNKNQICLNRTEKQDVKKINSALKWRTWGCGTVRSGSYAFYIYFAFKPKYRYGYLEHYTDTDTDSGIALYQSYCLYVAIMNILCC